MKIAGRIGIVVLVLIGVLAVFLWWPLAKLETPATRPALSYAEAMERVAQGNTSAVGPLYPGCESTALTHGDTVEKVVVYFHGYKACPLQFAKVGEQLHEMGYNVYMPRMPKMGLADQYAPETAELEAEEVLTFIQESLDIAQGLGDEVIVVGLSAGGGLATWTAQFRDDVDRVVVVSPLIVPGVVPEGLVNQAVRVYGTLPNRFQWSNPELKEDMPNPDYVYSRNATRVASELLRVSAAARASAAKEAPAVDEVVMVTNAADKVINREVTAEIVENWRNNGAASVQTYEFPAEYELNHDMIAHDHPEQDVEKVHPVLIDLITE